MVDLLLEYCPCQPESLVLLLLLLFWESLMQIGSRSLHQNSTGVKAASAVLEITTL